jgi:hypothetical protein
MCATTARLAEAQTITVTAPLTGAEENPAALTGAFGNATVTIDRGAGKITYRINVYNLSAGLTASHIHVGPPTTNGPVIFNFNFQPIVSISNDFSITGELTAADLLPSAVNGINSFEDAIFAIASGNAYANVHSTRYPGGEVRGQLCPDAAKDNSLTGTALCIAKK